MPSENKIGKSMKSKFAWIDEIRSYYTHPEEGIPSIYCDSIGRVAVWNSQNRLWDWYYLRNLEYYKINSTDSLSGDATLIQS